MSRHLEYLVPAIPTDGRAGFLGFYYSQVRAHKLCNQPWYHRIAATNTQGAGEELDRPGNALRSLVGEEVLVSRKSSAVFGYEQAKLIGIIVAFVEQIFLRHVVAR